MRCAKLQVCLTAAEAGQNCVLGPGGQQVLSERAFAAVPRLRIGRIQHCDSLDLCSVGGEAPEPFSQCRHITGLNRHHNVLWHDHSLKRSTPCIPRMHLLQKYQHLCHEEPSTPFLGVGQASSSGGGVWWWCAECL